MAVTEIQVTFDAATESFSYSPEQAPLDGQDPQARLNLTTVGGTRSATFASPNPLMWRVQDLAGITVSLEGPTTVAIQGFPLNSTQRYEYAVTVHYEGSSITSEGWPTMGPTGTGGGG